MDDFKINFCNFVNSLSTLPWEDVLANFKNSTQTSIHINFLDI